MLRAISPTVGLEGEITMVSPGFSSWLNCETGSPLTSTWRLRSSDLILSRLFLGSELFREFEGGLKIVPSSRGKEVIYPEFSSKDEEGGDEKSEYGNEAADDGLDEDDDQIAPGADTSLLSW